MRRLRSDDAEVVAEWARGAGWTGWTAPELRSAWSHQRAVTVALERDGELVGCAFGTTVVDEASVDLVVVAPAHRGAGLGRAVVSAWEAEAARRGARIAHLEVAETNRGARRLYAARGFREEGKRGRYYSDGRDALLLVKRLPAPADRAVAAVILAGGRARRLGGRSKALLRRTDGRTLLEALVETLHPDVDRLWLASPAAVRRSLRLAEPRVWSLAAVDDPGRGPGVAVQRASEQATEPWLLWTVADIPRPHPDLWRALLDARADGVEAVVPRWRDTLQPGFAVVRREALPREEVPSLQGLLRGLRRVELDESVLSTSALGALDDVDAPSDLARLRGPRLALRSGRAEDPDDAA